MIDVPELGDDCHHMWVELIRLGEVPPAAWTLIGAQMVALQGWAHGRTPTRPSVDADVLVDVRAVTRGTSRFSEALLASGFELDGVSPDGIGHRFVKQGVRIDILAPDGLGKRSDLRTVAAARTVQVPGGTQALHRSEPVQVRTRSIEGVVPVPNLLGAILVKARAIGVDDQPDAQRRDLAFLLSLVSDPDVLAAGLSLSERKWLRRHSEFAEPTTLWYRGILNAEDAAIAYRRMTRLSP